MVNLISRYKLFLLVSASLFAHAALLLWTEDNPLFDDQTTTDAGKTQQLQFSITPIVKPSPFIPEEPAHPAKPTEKTIEQKTAEQPEPITKKTLLQPKTVLQSTPVKTIDSDAKPLAVQEPVKISKPAPATPSPATPSKTASTSPIQQDEDNPLRQKQRRRHYLNQILTAIEKKKYYPRLAKRRQITGKVTVTLKLSSSGHVEHVTLHNAHSSLKKATKKAIVQAQPFTQPPDHIDISIPFKFVIAYKLE